MRYDVMVNCPDGTWTLKNDCWEMNRTTITWARYDTPAEAEAVKADLLAGSSPGTLRVWVEPVTTTDTAYPPG